METGSTNDQQRFSATIEGRVQGVGFRFFTRKMARDLGLTGWVKNNNDGSVTVVAEGARGQLDQLIDSLQDGPMTAVVEHIDVDWQDADGGFEEFTVHR